ncbi:MAG: twin-arginine translocase TatA/TatE family subunit [Firmicutes bacterium]|nr:twin-arginine translocase TatA/TatE family subunit [Bacillota bacterium]
MKLGATEVLLILLAILLLFGANRLPELARAIGRSVTELKEGIKSKPEAPAVATEEKEGKV